MPQIKNSLGNPCPEDKDHNPFTRRCNKKCKNDQERFSDATKKKFKCFRKCAPRTVRNAKTKRCIKSNKTAKKDIEKVLKDLDSGNNREEEDVQALVYQFSELMKLHGKKNKNIQKMINGDTGLHFDDDVKNDLDNIFNRFP